MGLFDVSQNTMHQIKSIRVNYAGSNNVLKLFGRL